MRAYSVEGVDRDMDIPSEGGDYLQYLRGVWAILLNPAKMLGRILRMRADVYNILFGTVSTEYRLDLPAALWNIEPPPIRPATSVFYATSLWSPKFGGTVIITSGTYYHWILATCDGP